MIINHNKDLLNKNKENNNDDNKDNDEDKDKQKQENKEVENDEISSQILILSSNIPSTHNDRNTFNNNNKPRESMIESHEESHSSLFAEQYIPPINYNHNKRLFQSPSLLGLNNNDNNNISRKPALKRYSTEPISTKTSRTSSPSGTPPPDEKKNNQKDRDFENKDDKDQTPFGYGINEEKAVSQQYHNHYSHRNRDHLTQSIHKLNVLQHSNSNGSDGTFNPSLNNGLTSIPSNKAASKYKMDVISCQVIIFHNIHKLTKAMQSMVIQIMKMKCIPTPEHNIHQKSSPSNQLCICTRQNNGFIPYLLRDMCLIDYVIPSKKCLQKLHKFVKYDMNEHQQKYYSHITGISFDGSNDNKFKINQLYDNNLHVAVNYNTMHYNQIQSQSPTQQPQSILINNSNSNGNTVGPMKLKDAIINNDNTTIDNDHYGLFPIPRLKILYTLVNRVFIHNSIAQYIRDIIIAIRLHPDVRNGCSSFRANDSLNISSKFTNFMSRLEERYKRLSKSNNKVDQIIARVHFVRPKDVDNIAIQILSHRIDIITNEYSPTPESWNDNKQNSKFPNIHKFKTQFKQSRNTNNSNNKYINHNNMPSVPFNEVQPMKSFPGFGSNQNRKKRSIDDDKHSSSDVDDDDDNANFDKKAKAEILKQLRLDNKASMRRRGGGYRTGSMSLPRTPRMKRSLSHSQMYEDEKRKYYKQKRSYYKGKKDKNNGKTKYHRRGRSRSRTINDIQIQENIGNNKEIEMKDDDDFDVEDFEFELFSDSDDYSYIDDDDEYYDDDDDADYNQDDDYDDDEYVEEYDDLYIDENIHSDYNDNNYGTIPSSKRNSANNRGNTDRSNGNNNNNYIDTDNSLLNTNEKKLNSEQRLVYNLLRRVLLPPK